MVSLGVSVGHVCRRAYVVYWVYVWLICSVGCMWSQRVVHMFRRSYVVSLGVCVVHMLCRSNVLSLSVSVVHMLCRSYVVLLGVCVVHMFRRS